jgi:hypothetical protein
MVLLFIKYDFKIKLSRNHLMANALSRLLDQTTPIGVLDQTCDAHMFTT